MSSSFKHLLRPIVGDGLDLSRDVLGFLTQKAAHADIGEFRVGRQRMLLAAHPDAVRHVLRDQADRYAKTKFAEKLKPVLGEGLATANGDRWKASRKVAQEALHKDHFERMLPGIATATARWQNRLRGGQDTPIMASHAACALALEMVVAAIFGEDAASYAPRILHAVEHIQHVLASRMWSVLPDLPWSPTKRRLRSAIADIEAVIDELIARRARAEIRDDFLGRLMNDIDEATGAPFSARQIRDEVVTMLVAGHETTGNALAWAIAEVAARPDLASRIADEAGSLEPTVSAVRALSFTRQVVQEVLRLRPTAFWFARTALSDDTLMGVPVRSGDVLVISQYVTHRLPAFWQQPDIFDPDRFAPGAQVGRHPFAYLPFGAGARSCPGGNLAMVEMVYALAAITRDFTLVPVTPAREEALVTLRPGDATVRFVPRVVEPARRAFG